MLPGARRSPEWVTKPPAILPPPKFKMIAKSQPLPPMRGEPGFEGEEEEVPATIADTDIEETGEESPEAAVEVEEFEAPVDEEAPPPPPRPAPAKNKDAKTAAKAPGAKAEKKSPKKPERKR